MNNNGSDLTYTDLKVKQVVDVSEGKNLGHICDMVFSPDLKTVLGIIAPYGKKGLIGKSQEIFIPRKCIKNIGEDIITVEINSTSSGQGENNENNCMAGCEGAQCANVPPSAASAVISGQNFPNCDRRCDKCMLFDCQFRWKGKAF